MNADPINIDRLLSGIEKPARYTGGELNAIVKTDAAFRMGLCFPDLYEVGMSNAGIQVLYSRVNAISGASCERVFAVAPDFEKRLWESAVPLFTLETRTPLKKMDALGFNLAHELLLTGMLQVLDLGGVPLLRDERGEGDPIVLAGGECVSNPTPVEQFIDAFCVGDGEELIVEIVRTLMQMKKNKVSRAEMLKNLETISGVYLPGKGGGAKVQKRIYRSPSPSWPTRPVVPNIRTAQVKAAIEITRGCPNLCSFCHAGFYDLPYRTLDSEAVRDAVLETIRNTGYDEFTLASLSVSDYPFLIALLNEIIPELTRKGVSISLPSLRIDRETLPLLEKLSGVRKSSLTFAVESASEPLRQRANKRLSNDEVKEIVRRVCEMGWRLIKLYFMVGLPGCEEADEAGDIVRLLKDLHQLGRKKLELNVTVSPFVPKPHTPFEREAMRPREYFEETIRNIRRSVPRGITIKAHDINASMLEAVLARGDAKLSEVIMAAYREGCRFDAWSEHFRFETWQRLLGEIIPGWQSYLQKRPPDEILPWSAITTGFERLIAIRSGKTSALPPIKTRLRGGFMDDEFIRAQEDFVRTFQVNARARIRFEKTGDARFIPHIDFVEIVKRALRMAEVPVSFTQGFNKRERLSAGFPLPLGVESLAELIDLDLWHVIEPENTIENINQRLPKGMKAAHMRLLANEEKESLMALTSAVEYCLTAEEKLIETILARLAEKPELIKEGKSGKKIISFDEAVCRWEAQEGGIIILLSSGSPESVRIDALVSFLIQQEPEDVISMMRIIKTAQYHKIAQQYTMIQ